ncbi:Thymidylate synthase 2 [compost metagenome]
MNSKFEKGYMAILANLLVDGAPRQDRTGVGTLAKFGVELEHDWQDGYPVITHRMLNPRMGMAEMACFIRGLNDIRDFEARGCRWWRANLNDFNARKGTPENLSLGPIYGYKWRNFHGFDQLAWLLKEAEENPHSRRLMVTAWDPSDQVHAVLPPCHYAWQIFIDGPTLDLKFEMRSVDWVLGCPADFIAYAFLQLALCRHLGLNPGKLLGSFGDTHVYNSHVKGVNELLKTTIERDLPQWSWYSGDPMLALTYDALELEPEHLLLHGLEQGPSCSFKMAV